MIAALHVRPSSPDEALPEPRLSCPRCEARSLVELVRDGVTIDRCTKCRGVWLDRGELERLLEQARADERAGDADEAPTRAYDRELLRVPASADDLDGDPPRRPRRGWWDL